MSKIKLLLADDHAVVRSGLRMLLEAQPDMEIVAEAENGRETIEKVLAFQPDIGSNNQTHRISQSGTLITFFTNQ